MQPSNNKDHSVVFRTDKKLWKKFIKLARIKDSNASTEIRKFMKEYIAINEK
jgi:hypothetical protein